jgi:hypothetical protein
MTQVYSTREEWLTAGVEELRPLFESVNRPVASKVRIACGFPLDAKRSGAIGQCWSDQNSADSTVEILISPELADPIKVFEVLVHELCHATPNGMNHGKPFKHIASLMLLEPANGTKREPWKATKGNAQFLDAYRDIIDGLGAYPHAPLTYQTKKTQTTRMIKASCPSCGYTVRLTAKWAALGLPTCPCGDDLAL